MTDDTANPSPSESPGHARATDAPPWWRLPLIATLIAVPILVGAGGIGLGCETGTLDLPICGGEAQVAPMGHDVEVSEGQATIWVSDPGGAPVMVSQEPAAVFAGQFTKFVVVSPDGGSVLYVTATSLGMTDAKLWVMPRGQPKALLKDLGDDFWVARPVWCQARTGDPGRIAYVTRGAVGGDLTGLELWIINGDGSGDRRVLVGSNQNGFGPDIFYGDRPTPLQFMAGCERLRYTPGDNSDTRIVDVLTGETHDPIGLPHLPLPPMPAGGPGATPPCLVKPFAQTDPRWGNDLMKTGNTAIRSWGCALTSTAMVFNYYGVDTDPGRLNVCASDQADELYWEPVRARCAADKTPLPVRWNGQARWADLEASLRAGHPVIVGMRGGPAGSHFVVVTSGAGDQAGNYKIVEFWDGSTYKTLADYINPKKGYLLTWLVIFEGAPPPCETAVAVAEPSAIAFLNPADGGVYNAPQPVRFQVNAQPGVKVESTVPDGAIIGDEGPHTLTVTATQGEQVTRRRLSFLIDRTPPRVSAAWQPLSASSGRLSLTATDDLTAVSEAQFRVDDGPWRPISAGSAERVGLDLKPVTVDGLTPGAHMARYYAVDAAGNRSPEAELRFVVGPPAVALLLDGAPLPTDNAVVELAAEGGERTLSLANSGSAPLQVTIDRARLGGWVQLADGQGPQGPAATLAVEPGRSTALRLSLTPGQSSGGSQLSRLTLGISRQDSNEPPLLLMVTVAVTRGVTPRPIVTAGPGGAPPPLPKPLPTAAPTAAPTLPPAHPRPAIARLSGKGFVDAPAGAPRELYRPAGNGGFTLVVHGSNFVGASVVRWGGKPLRTRLAAPDQLEASVDDDDVERVGSYAVAVVSPAPGGGVSNALTVHVTDNPRPSIAMLAGDDLTASPTGTGVGYRHVAELGFTLVIRGAGFVESSEVLWGEKRLRTKHIGDDRLEADLGDDEVARAGAYSVAVVTPAPGGGMSNQITVTLYENPRPVLKELVAKGFLPPAADDPTGYAWPIGNKGFTLTLRGADFVEDSVARWNGKRLKTKRVSANELQAQVEDEDVEKVGNVAVTVATPRPGGGESGGLTIAIVENPKPSISRLEGDGLGSPPTDATALTYRRAAGNGGFTLTVRGAGFIEASRVRWNGKTMGAKLVSDTQIDVKIDDEEIEKVGAYAVTVVSPAPGGGETAAARIDVFENPRPSISRLDGPGLVVAASAGAAPANRRLAGNGGFTLIVRGDGFVEDSVVRWNGRSLPTKHVNATQLEALVADDDVERVGAYMVTVSNPKPGGGESSALTVTIVENPKPSISRLEGKGFLAPPTGAPPGDYYRPVSNGGFTMTVRGQGFVEDSAVRLNDRGLRAKYVSATELEAEIEDEQIERVAAYAVVVVNPKPGGGTSNEATVRVTDNPRPAIASLSVASVKAGAKETTVTVRGSNFVERAAGRWNGENRKTSYLGANELRITLTAADLARAGAFSITVANPSPGGGASNAVTFTVAP